MSAPCMSVMTGSASSAEAGTSTFCFLLVPEMILPDRLPAIATVWWLTFCLCACRTAKVWKNWQLEYTLKGHEQSVWAVLALDGPEDDLVLTGKHPLHPERSTFATVKLTLDCPHVQAPPTTLCGYSAATSSSRRSGDTRRRCAPSPSSTRVPEVESEKTGSPAVATTGELSFRQDVWRSCAFAKSPALTPTPLPAALSGCGRSSRASACIPSMGTTLSSTPSPPFPILSAAGSSRAARTARSGSGVRPTGNASRLSRCRQSQVRPSIPNPET